MELNEEKRFDRDANPDMSSINIGLEEAQSSKCFQLEVSEVGEIAIPSTQLQQTRNSYFQR